MSPDTLETHRGFAKQHGFSFPLLTDDGTIRKLYGRGRITYLIDASGVIRYIKKGMPENDRLIEAIRALPSD